MIAHAALLAALAVLQVAWFVVYVTGPWRDTRLGWAWLLKGGMFALLWVTWFVDVAVVNVPDWLWTALGVGLLAATATWLWATIRVRMGRLRAD